MGLRRAARNHWHHHARFYLATLLGIAVAVPPWTRDPQLRVVLAGDVFYVAYLTAMAVFISRINPAAMRQRAGVADEGVFLIVLITLGVIVFSLLSLFGILGQKENPDVLLLALSIASVPLGWFTLHLILAFRYAHLYYLAGEGKTKRDAGGLAFPGTDEPTGWDFVYHAFVIGGTAQVSDVDVTSTRMRRLTWAHSTIAFFYNTVLIALAVNIAVQSNGG